MPATTRTKILEVAAEYFASEGYAAARMTEIANRAGIARATLYKHFDTKQAVLLAINEAVIQDARQQLALLNGNRDDAQPSHAQRIADWFEQGLTSQWRLNAMRVVVIEETQTPLSDDQGATQAIVKDVQRTLVDVIKRGIACGEFSPALQPRDTAHVIQAMLLGLQRNNVSARPLLPVTINTHLKAASGLILQGLSAGAQPT